MTAAFQSRGLLGAVDALGTGIFNAFVDIGKSMLGIKDAIGEAEQAALDWSKSNDEAIISVEKQNARMDVLYDRIVELNSVENLSAVQKEELRRYVDELNTALGEEVIAIDEETGYIQTSNETIEESIRLKKEDALASVYRERAIETAARLAEAEATLFDAQVDLNVVERDLAKADEELSKKKEELYKQYEGNADIESIVTDKLSEEIEKVNELRGKRDELKGVIDDNTAAIAELQQEETRQNNMADITTGKLDELLSQIGKTADELTPTLLEGLQTGRLEIPKTVDELNAIIDFDEAVENAGEDGEELVNTLYKKISSGELTVQEAADMLRVATETPLDGLGQFGADVGSNLSSSLAGNLDGSAAFAKAEEIASGIKSRIQNAFQIFSPSRWAKWIGDMTTKGLGVGLEEGIAKHIDPAVDDVNESINFTSDTPEFAFEGGGGDMASVMRSMFNELFRRLQDFDMPIVLDSGELVGALTPQFDESLGLLSVRKARG